MDVRLARPTDAPLVLALTLDEHAHLVKSLDSAAAKPALRSLVRSFFPLAFPGRTWIAREGANVALLEARPRRYVIGWDVTRLVVRGDRMRVLGPVIEAVSCHLRSKGVPRLFARCQEDARVELQSFGFRALTREYVLLGSTGEAPEPMPLPADSRYRMPQDAWPLHQLENEVTPPLVRQLEGLTSLEWSQGEKGVSEIVVEHDGRVVGWVGWGPSEIPGIQQIGLLIRPDHAELASILLGHILCQAAPRTRFLARIRDYQPETLNALTDAGFSIVAEDILMVRHGLVELARVEPARMRVARVPGIQAFPLRIRAPDPTIPGVALGAGQQKEQHL